MEVTFKLYNPEKVLTCMLSRNKNIIQRKLKYALSIQQIVSSNALQTLHGTGK